MLDVNNIDLHYGAAQALRGISLKLVPGKIMCVIGRNGVGKSSLLRAIVGHRPISSGEWESSALPMEKLVATSVHHPPGWC